MNFSKQKIVIFGGIGLLILIVIFVVVAFSGGGKTTQTPIVQGNLNVWVYGETPQSYADIIGAFNKTYPNVKVNVRQFSDYGVYANQLLEAMAVGQSPDIFMVPSTELPAYANKIMPAPAATITPLAVSQLFPQVVSQDFVMNGSVYGLPLSIDTLALIYNKDIFAKAGIVYPPSTWQDFQKDAKALTLISANGTITQSGAALGTSNTTVDNGADLLYLLMLQTGTQMTDPVKQVASFNSPAGQNAVSFYTSFANPRDPSYSWNGAMSNSLDAFAQNKVGMMLDYEASLAALRAKNSFLNYGVAPAPQPASSTVSVSYPRYAGYVVSRQSKYPSFAWSFITFMATNPANAGLYAAATGEPPALLSLVNASLNDINLSAFVKQELYARSWYGPNRDQIDQIFSSMIDSINTNQLNIKDAVTQAEDQVTNILNSL